MVGLGTMGCNLVLNMSDHGFSVAGYDKDAAKVEVLNKYATEKKLSAFSDITSFLQSLEIPRVIMLLVPAGNIVDVSANKTSGSGNLRLKFGNDTVKGCDVC